MAVESRGDLASRHGSIGRFAAAHSWSYRSDNPICTRTNHASVKHSVSEYARGQVHTNGIESFWAVLKRAHKGTFHRLSAKHLHRYVDEFVGRHNMRELDTLDQMALIARKMTGSQLRYKDLVG